MNKIKIFLLTLILNFSSLSQSDVRVYLDRALITDIKQDRDFLLVATYGQGIYEYSIKDEVWKNFSTKSGDINSDLFHCVASSEEFIWAGSNEGLHIYNRKSKKWTVKKFLEGGEFGNWIRALYYDKKRNLLWIGRFSNVTLLDVKQNAYREFNRTISNNSKTNNINTISADGDSVIWFGAEFGVHKLVLDSKNQFNNWTYFNNKSRAFLTEGDMVSVSDILPTKSSIWFATDEFITRDNPQYNIGGIYINNRKFDWKRISKSDGLAGNGVFCLTRIGNNVIAGLYEFDPIKKTETGKGLAVINLTTHKVNNISQEIIKISEARSIHFDGINLWIGTSSGLIRVKISNKLASWGVR